MRLKFKDGRVTKLSVYPGEEGTTQVLEVVGLMTPTIAKRLQMSSGVYNEEGVPLDYQRYPEPKARIDGADITLDDKTFRATLIHKFKVTVPESNKDDGKPSFLECHFRIHFVGKEPVIFWLNKNNKDLFVCEISARQEDLNFGDEKEEEEPEAELGPCTSCNNNVPLGLAGFHTNGQPCKTAAAEKEPALATAKEAAGGTPGRAGKKGQTAAEPVQ